MPPRFVFEATELDDSRMRTDFVNSANLFIKILRNKCWKIYQISQTMHQTISYLLYIYRHNKKCKLIIQPLDTCYNVNKFYSCTFKPFIIRLLNLTSPWFARTFACPLVRIILKWIKLNKCQFITHVFIVDAAAACLLAVVT